MWGVADFPGDESHSGDGSEFPRRDSIYSDVHLRGMKELKGYAIEATDGVLGSVKGFMVDDKDWSIAELIVETGHWYSGKEILIPTGLIERICHKDSKVFVRLTKADLRRTEANEVAKTCA